MSTRPTPILMDCDPGHDDAIALVMAYRSPAIDLLGVTTTCGNAGIEKTTRNCLRILEAIGATAVPVASGCVRPLSRPLVLGTADGPSGLEGSTYLPDPTMTVQPVHAVDFLAQKLNDAPEPIDFVATGPLTNLALLFLKYPAVIAKIRMLTWMGGVFYRKSEIISPTEFNAFCDPEALRVVLESNVPMTMVGLDVTRRVLIEAPQFEELSKIDTPLGRLVTDWLKYYDKLHRKTMNIGGAMHDPLALAAIIDPTLIKTRPVHIAVELGGTHTFGATVADFWGTRGEANNANIAFDVDVDRFFDLMFGLLKG